MHSLKVQHSLKHSLGLQGGAQKHRRVKHSNENTVLNAI